MRITNRVKHLERAIKPERCRVCTDATIGLIFDPPHPEGKPMMMAGIVCPAVPCVACGKLPRIVLSMPPRG